VDPEFLKRKHNCRNEINLLYYIWISISMEGSTQISTALLMKAIANKKRACINACVIEKGLSPVRDIDPSGCGSIDEHAKLDRNATEKRGDPPAADAEWRRRQVAAAWRRDERHRNGTGGGAARWRSEGRGRSVG